MMPVHLTGLLICANDADAALVAQLLPDHIRLTRAEAGCEMFTVTQSADPKVWDVAERFSTQANFDAHQTRTQASAWGKQTGHIARDFTLRTD
jgi:quinol monooxygenase YgiN